MEARACLICAACIGAALALEQATVVGAQAPPAQSPAAAAQPPAAAAPEPPSAPSVQPPAVPQPTTEASPAAGAAAAQAGEGGGATAVDATPAPPPGAAPAPAEPAAAVPHAIPPAPDNPTPPPIVCEPTCAQGYVCREGSCVSSCYPPCGFGERCQAGGCVSGAPSVAADGSPRWNWGGAGPHADADAAAPPPPQGYHTHDGFLLRGFLTLGGGNATYGGPGGSRELPGGGLNAGLDIGARIAGDVVLFARLGSYGFRADVKTDGDSAAAASADDPVARFEGGLFGIGASYYLMPHNVYLGGALAALGANVQNVDGSGVQDIELQTDAAFVLQLEGAKEWWIGGNWGIGVGARLSMGSGTLVERPPEGRDARDAIEDAGGPFETTFDHFAFDVLGSVTYQ